MPLIYIYIPNPVKNSSLNSSATLPNILISGCLSTWNLFDKYYGDTPFYPYSKV